MKVSEQLQQYYNSINDYFNAKEKLIGCIPEFKALLSQPGYYNKPQEVADDLRICIKDYTNNLEKLIPGKDAYETRQRLNEDTYSNIFWTGCFWGAVIALFVNILLGVLIIGIGAVISKRIYDVTELRIEISRAKFRDMLNKIQNDLNNVKGNIKDNKDFELNISNIISKFEKVKENFKLLQDVTVTVYDLELYNKLKGQIFELLNKLKDQVEVELKNNPCPTDDSAKKISVEMSTEDRIDKILEWRELLNARIAFGELPKLLDTNGLMPKLKENGKISPDLTVRKEAIPEERNQNSLKGRESRSDVVVNSSINNQPNLGDSNPTKGFDKT